MAAQRRRALGAGSRRRAALACLTILLASVVVVAIAGTHARGSDAGDVGRPSGSVAVPVATAVAVPPTVGAAVGLDALRIDDHPHTQGYRRDEWPQWKDIDGDGCDARQQALIAASAVPVGRTGCHVTSGSWTSAYDGLTFTDPSDLDIDHVVPLENAYASGGWQWSTDQRAAYANDQPDLWVVSAASNRSKGAKGPDEWRPPAHDVWCTYATRWLGIKVRWGLSATTAERDALGQMLETCAGHTGA